MSQKPSPLMERLISVYQNNAALVTIIAILLGLLLRFLATPKPIDDLPELGRELMREVGTFLLVTFLVAFLYESFVSVRARKEFREELHDLFSSKMRLGIHAVYTRRPTVEFKADILRQAEGDLYEVGEALNTFRTYITSNMATGMGRDSIGYRDLMELRLKDGLNVTCLMLDPDFADLPGIKEEQPGLAEKIRQSYQALSAFANQMSAKKYKGSFQIYLYHAPPKFAAIYAAQLDGDARLLLSPYIPGTENSATPVFDLRRSENLELFDKYHKGIESLLSRGVKVAPAVAPAPEAIHRNNKLV